MLALAVFVACGPWNVQNIRTESDERHVLFTFAGKAESVCLSGDFNGWSPGSLCLEMDDDGWKVDVLLAPGRYRYAFLLDGKDWVPDPGALLLEEDGFGRLNSVLVVE